MKRMITIEAEGSNEALNKLEKFLDGFAESLLEECELKSYCITKDNEKEGIKIPEFIIRKHGRAKKEAV